MKKGLRKGFTTGSCAAAASKAAAEMLFSGKIIKQVALETPAGEIFETEINYVNLEKDKSASCAVLKDGGDDPDVTTGLYIYSEVSVVDGSIMLTKETPAINSGMGETVAGDDGVRIMSTSLRRSVTILIDGGKGIGKVTKPGLDRSVGEAAINSVPRRMIEQAVRSEAEKAGFTGTLSVIISAPGGEKTAEKTFNPRLGIKGGISILGTSGVESPMSEQALIDTIEVEMKMHRAAGEDSIAVTPGNYGQDFMLKTYGYDIDRSVKCSNFIGDALDIAGNLGFAELLLTGHIGKLIKLTGGITNTHSANADCRMELLSASALRSGCEANTCRNILDCVSTEEALRLIKEAGKLKAVMEDVMIRVMDTVRRRADEELNVECMIYSNDFGLLAKSGGAEELLEKIKGR